MYNWERETQPELDPKCTTDVSLLMEKADVLLLRYKERDAAAMTCNRLFYNADWKIISASSCKILDNLCIKLRLKGLINDKYHDKNRALEIMCMSYSYNFVCSYYQVSSYLKKLCIRTCFAEGTLGSPHSMAFFSSNSKSALPACSMIE